MQVRMRFPIKKSGSLRFAVGRAPSDSAICARLPLAKTRPSAISAESAIIRLRNVARMTGGSEPYSVCDLNFSTKARMSPSGLPRLDLHADVGRCMGDADAKLEPPARNLMQIGGVLRELVDRLCIDRRDGGGKWNAFSRQCEADALRHVAEGTRHRYAGKAAPLNLARGIERGTPASRLGDQVKSGQGCRHRR